MKILISLLLLCGCLLHPMTVRAAETTLDQASLKTMVEGLGYEPKEGSSTTKEPQKRYPLEDDTKIEKGKF